jgi:catechol 2,3-dioxygenase-like lactoylglutathione lyase family enzyme
MPVGTKNVVIAGCGMHHISIQTRDWEASLHLYQEVLGMSEAAKFGPKDRAIVLLDMGDGSHIELMPPKLETEVIENTVTGNPILHFALATTDTRSAIEHIRRSGYEITVEPKTVDLNGMSVTLAFFIGPNGEEIELFQIHQT